MRNYSSRVNSSGDGDMRSIGLISLSVMSCLISACSGEQTSPASARSVIDNAISAVTDTALGQPDEDWSIDEASSTIDGEIVSATRWFFPDDQTTFAAEVECIPASGVVGIAIDSYVGDVAEPSPGSEFSRTARRDLFGGTTIVPLGRVKPSGMEVRHLAALFLMSSAASNRIELVELPTHDPVINVSEELRQQMDEVDINYARVVSDMLPLAIEVNNGTGKHELIIDPSPEVVQVLTKCGGTGDVLKPEGLSRIQAAAAARQKASDEAKRQEEQRLAAMEAEAEAYKKSLCRNRGSYPIYKEMCESTYQDEYAAFQRDIDQLVADVKQKRCNLTRDSIESNASSNGIDSERERIAAMDKCSWWR